MWSVNRPEAVRINALNAAVASFKVDHYVNTELVLAVAATYENYIYKGNANG